MKMKNNVMMGMLLMGLSVCSGVVQAMDHGIVIEANKICPSCTLENRPELTHCHACNAELPPSRRSPARQPAYNSAAAPKAAQPAPKRPLAYNPAAAGAAQSEQICKGCNYLNDAQIVFCGGCGKKLANLPAPKAADRLSMPRMGDALNNQQRERAKSEVRNTRQEIPDVECSACTATNRGTARFCITCNTPLPGALQVPYPSYNVGAGDLGNVNGDLDDHAATALALAQSAQDQPASVGAGAGGAGLIDEGAILQCPTCTHRNEPTAQFCTFCGSSFDRPPAPALRVPAPPVAVPVRVDDAPIAPNIDPLENRNTALRLAAFGFLSGAMHNSERLVRFAPLLVKLYQLQKAAGHGLGHSALVGNMNRDVVLSNSGRWAALFTGTELLATRGIAGSLSREGLRAGAGSLARNFIMAFGAHAVVALYRDPRCVGLRARLSEMATAQVRALLGGNRSQGVEPYSGRGGKLGGR